MSSKISRRQFVSGVAAAAAGLMARTRARASTPAVRPHYVVQILLSGGYDSMLFIDPKTPGDLNEGLDIGYRPEDRLRGARRLYGPLFAPLMPHESELCIVNGARVDTVGHDEAQRSVARGRVDYSQGTPIIGDLVGAALPGQAPISHLASQNSYGILPLGTRAYEPKALLLPRSMVEGVSARGITRPAWADVVDEERARRGDALFRHDLRMRDDYRRSLLQSAALRRFFTTLPPMEQPAQDPHLGPELHIALHAIKANFARFISVAAYPLWCDSHTDNWRSQCMRLIPALQDVSRFLTALKQESNSFGRLADQTTVLIGSELGRFPKLNAVAGKDHWPEVSWIWFGKGVRSAPGGLTMGGTDKQFCAIPVDFKTGAADSPERRPIYLNSIYATLLEMAGQNATRFGYARDSRLDYIIG
jgi:uncharacterized protein (DUF1501 family)